MSITQNLWKTILIPLAGITFSASLFGFVDKVEAQVNRNQQVSSFLTSGFGRWLEIEPERFGSCYIYDLKPTSFSGVLRVIRAQYPKTDPFLTFGLEPSPCRFSFPLGGLRQSIGVVGNNGSTLTIQLTGGTFIEQVQFVRFDSQSQILIRRNNVFNFWVR